MITVLSASLLALMGQAALSTDRAFPPLEEEAARALRAQAILCGCADAEPAIGKIEGVVTDAVMMLGADGRSPADRQTTVLDIVRVTGDLDIKGDVRIEHPTPDDDCGVSFDYGRRAVIPVRKTKEDGFETDICLQAGRTRETPPQTQDMVSEEPQNGTKNEADKGD